MNLTITEHLLVGENILVITVTEIKIALIFQGTRAGQSWVNSQLSLSSSGTIVSAKDYKILDGKK